MEATNKIKADFSKLIKPPITTMEEFNRVFYAGKYSGLENFDYWDETLSNDWDDDLARPDNYPITCMISNREKNIHYMFQVTNKALNDHDDWVQNHPYHPCKDDSVNEAVLTLSEDKDDSAIICFDFDQFVKKTTR